jgi:pimeloyl-ACP methyl ester carboxylesterase
MSNFVRHAMKKLLSILLPVVFLWAGGCKEEPPKTHPSTYDSGYVSILNTKMYYEIHGAGIPLILLQGGGIGHGIKDFARCMPELSQHFKVFAPDTPGQGKSEMADSMSYPLIAEYMSQFIDKMKLDSVYIMGWSDGGIVALLLAEKRPDKVKKVLAVSANYTLKGAVPPGIDMRRVGPKALAGWEKENRPVIDAYMKVLPRDWKKMRNDLNKMWYQHVYFPSSTLERIHIPVMIAQGDRDVINLEHGIEMHRLVKGSQFCVLPNTSHAVFEESPKLITHLACEFFK